MKNINGDEKRHFPWPKYLAIKIFPECERTPHVTRKIKGKDCISSVIMERIKFREVLYPENSNSYSIHTSKMTWNKS